MHLNMLNNLNEREVEKKVEEYMDNHVFIKTNSVVSTILHDEGLKKRYKRKVRSRITTIVRLSLKKHYDNGRMEIYRNGNPRVYKRVT